MSGKRTRLNSDPSQHCQLETVNRKQVAVPLEMPVGLNSPRNRSAIQSSSSAMTLGHTAPTAHQNDGFDNLFHDPPANETNAHGSSAHSQSNQPNNASISAEFRILQRIQDSMAAMNADDVSHAVPPPGNSLIHTPSLPNATSRVNPTNFSSSQNSQRLPEVDIATLLLHRSNGNGEQANANSLVQVDLGQADHLQVTDNNQRVRNEFENGNFNANSNSNDVPQVLERQPSASEQLNSAVVRRNLNDSFNGYSRTQENNNNNNASSSEAHSNLKNRTRNSSDVNSAPRLDRNGQAQFDPLVPNENAVLNQNPSSIHTNSRRPNSYPPTALGNDSSNRFGSRSQDVRENVNARPRNNTHGQSRYSKPKEGNNHRSTQNENWRDTNASNFRPQNVGSYPAATGNPRTQASQFSPHSNSWVLPPPPTFTPVYQGDQVNMTSGNPLFNSGSYFNDSVFSNRSYLRNMQLPTFKGRHDTQSPYEFIEALLHYQASLGISEQEMLLNVLRSSLREEAHQWYQMEQLLVPVLNMQDFCSRFRKKYQGYDYEEKLRSELDRRTQDLDEPLSDYIRKIAGYYQRLNMPIIDVEFIPRIIRKLNPECSNYFRDLSAVMSIYELKAQADTIDELIARKKAYKRPPIYNSVEPTLLAYGNENFQSYQRSRSPIPWQSSRNYHYTDPHIENKMYAEKSESRSGSPYPRKVHFDTNRNENYYFHEHSPVSNARNYYDQPSDSNLRSDSPNSRESYFPTENRYGNENYSQRSYGKDEQEQRESRSSSTYDTQPHNNAPTSSNFQSRENYRNNIESRNENRNQFSRPPSPLKLSTCERLARSRSPSPMPRQPESHVPIKCYECGGDHIIRDCPNRNSISGNGRRPRQS